MKVDRRHRTEPGPRAAEAMKLRAEGHTLFQIGELMGIAGDRGRKEAAVCNLLRQGARYAGVAPTSVHDDDDVLFDGVDSWDEGEAHCGRCGLRGAHVCLDAATNVSTPFSNLARAA